MNEIKVLLAEDEQTLALIIKDTLEAQGFVSAHFWLLSEFVNRSIKKEPSDPAQIREFFSQRK